jgi:hypothetical protein
MLLKVCVIVRDPGLTITYCIRKKYLITLSIQHIDVLRNFLITYISVIYFETWEDGNSVQ